MYREYVPHHPLAGDVRDDDGVYHSFTVGRVRVVVTDLRSHRSPQVMPDGPGKTMLGAAQLEWLEEELRAAAVQEQVVMWVSSTPWTGEPVHGADDWRGYDYERQLLAALFEELDVIDQLVMLGGDVHMVALDDGTHSGGFPSLQAAALDRRGSVKGGPYSHGTHPGGGQFGEIEVHDDGEAVEVVLRGLTYEHEVIVEERFDVTPNPR